MKELNKSKVSKISEKSPDWVVFQQICTLATPLNMFPIILQNVHNLTIMNSCPVR